jgi:hypothetical protein
LDKDRIAKANALNLTPIQVVTLASIVHKESLKKERPVIAGVYLNRLKQGMPLQADPTVIYAKKLKENNFDQIIKRVIHEDLFINSPYNTYLFEGLPPAPIAMPDVDAIDAVLNAENTITFIFVQVLKNLDHVLLLIIMSIKKCQKICRLVKCTRNNAIVSLRKKSHIAFPDFVQFSFGQNGIERFLKPSDTLNQKRLNTVLISEIVIEPLCWRSINLGMQIILVQNFIL